VARLTGVRGVSNLISVRAHVTPADIRERIERALTRNAEIDAHGITVNIAGTTVVLTGVVQAYYEKRAAEQSARSAPGITAVDNRIVIAPAS
jgi:osmotically-inducible protein OsmY